MKRIEITCFVLSGCMLVSSLVIFGVGRYFYNQADSYRENNVRYVTVSEDTSVAVDEATDVSKDQTVSEEKKDVHISAEEVQRIVEDSPQWQKRMDSIANVVYTWPTLDSAEPSGNKVKLTYLFESSNAVMKCSYDKVTGKVKVGKIYNAIAKKYPVLFWQCGHIPDINIRALEKFYEIGYVGIYTCEGDDSSTTVGFMDNDMNSDVIELE